MTGRAWAYIGAILGGAVSVAANVAHSWVPPDGAGTAWAPPAGAVIGAVFWPLALFVAVEILARVPWPPGWRYACVRYAGLLPVAVVAAVVSYRHLAGLLAFYGEDPLTVVIGPLAVDGLMVMATGALIATSRQTPTAATGARQPDPATTPAPAPAPTEPAEPLAPAPHPPTDVGATPDGLAPAPPPAPTLPGATPGGTATQTPETIIDLATQARQAYLDSVAAGAPLTGAELGQRFQRSASWGRAHIAETRKARQPERQPINGHKPHLVGAAGPVTPQE